MLSQLRSHDQGTAVINGVASIITQSTLPSVILPTPDIKKDLALHIRVLLKFELISFLIQRFNLELLIQIPLNDHELVLTFRVSSTIITYVKIIFTIVIIDSPIIWERQ